MTIRGYSQKSIHNSPYLKIYIPTAAALGGVCVGILTIFADFMGALGSGTGILLSVSIILTYVEQYLKEVEKNRIKILSKPYRSINLWKLYTIHTKFLNQMKHTIRNKRCLIDCHL